MTNTQPESSTANSALPGEGVLPSEKTITLSRWAVEFIEKYLPDQMVSIAAEYFGLFPNNTKSEK